MLACGNHHRFKLVGMLTKFQHHWGHLDSVGTSAENDSNPFLHDRADELHTLRVVAGRSGWLVGQSTQFFNLHTPKATAPLPFSSIAVVSSSSDKTLVPASDAAFRRSRFFERLPVACYACDCSGTITDYNRRAVELWGREPQATDKFTGAQRILDAQGEPLAPEATTVALLLLCGLTQRNKELVIVKPDGRRVTVLSNVAPLHDEDGNMIGVIDVVQDITDRRWSEDARRVAERLSASARIATEVAQLKPALLSMINLLNLLGQEATLSVQARGCAEAARVELMHFDAVVRQMAHLSGAA